MNQLSLTPPLILQKKLIQLKQQFQINKQSCEQASNLNQTLKPCLKVINSNLQTKIKPQHDKLLKQRKAIYELMNYDKKVSLKQNYLHFYHKSMTHKHKLTKNLSRIQKKNKQLAQISLNFNQQVQQTNGVKSSIMQDKIRMHNILSDLEQQKLKKLSVKSSIQEQRLRQIGKNSLNDSKCQQHDISEIDSLDHSQQQVLSYLNSSYSSQSISSNVSQTSSKSISSNVSQTSSKSIFSNVSQTELSITRPVQQKKNKSFHYHPQTFTNAHQIFDGLQANSKPKSKQILKSLEKQLNPLKLNEVILLLENYIHQLKKYKLEKLQTNKYFQERKAQSLKDKENHLNNKLEKIKTHIKNFQNYKFPNMTH